MTYFKDFFINLGKHTDFILLLLCKNEKKSLRPFLCMFLKLPSNFTDKIDSGEPLCVIHINVAL